MLGLNLKKVRIAFLGGSTALTFFLLGGCSQSSSATPPKSLSTDSFRVVVKNLVSNSSITVTQVNIEKEGAGKMQVKGNGFHHEIPVDSSARQSIGLNRAETIIFADLISEKNKTDNTLKLLIQSSNGISYVGGPGIWSAPGATKVGDVLTVAIRPGVYPLGTSLKLATLKGKPVTLSVK